MGEVQAGAPPVVPGAEVRAQGEQVRQVVKVVAEPAAGRQAVHEEGTPPGIAGVEFGPAHQQQPDRVGVQAGARQGRDQSRVQLLPRPLEIQQFPHKAHLPTYGQPQGGVLRVPQGLRL